MGARVSRLRAARIPRGGQELFLSESPPSSSHFILPQQILHAPEVRPDQLIFSMKLFGAPQHMDCQSRTSRMLAGLGGCLVERAVSPATKHMRVPSSAVVGKE